MSDWYSVSLTAGSAGASRSETTTAVTAFPEMPDLHLEVRRLPDG
jgi:hypothetical protein